MKKWIIAIMLQSLILTISIQTASKADVTLDPVAPNAALSISILDSYINRGAISGILGYNFTPPNSRGKTQKDITICETVADCRKLDLDEIDVLSILPTCVSLTQTNCVESAGVVRDGVTYTGISLGDVPGRTFPEDKSLGVPAGGTVGRWRVDLGDDSEFLAVHSLMTLNSMYSSKFKVNILDATVVPYDSVYGSFTPPIPILTHDIYGDVIPVISGLEPECAWVTLNECGKMVEYIPNDVYFLKLRITKGIGTWLSGRVDDPMISIDSINEESYNLSVAGKPMLVPKIIVSIPPDATLSSPHFAVINRKIQSEVSWKSYGGPELFEIVEELRQFSDDRSFGEYQIWQFSSLPDVECTQNKGEFVGFVSTNASIYQAEPPQINDGFLDYKIGGFHYEKDGLSLNSGVYNLVMRSDFAKCLYQLKSIPEYASVSVTDNNGFQKVTNTILKERDGWLHLSADGITFSEKTIRVQLNKEIQTSFSIRKGSAVLTPKVRKHITNFIFQNTKRAMIICSVGNEEKSEMAIQVATQICNYATRTSPGLKKIIKLTSHGANKKNWKVVLKLT